MNSDDVNDHIDSNNDTSKYYYTIPYQYHFINYIIVIIMDP